MNCPACTKPIPDKYTHVCPVCWQLVPAVDRVELYQMTARKQDTTSKVDKLVRNLKKKLERK